MAAERLSDRGFMPTWVRHEHLARYEFAAGYVAGKVVVDCACGDGTGSAQYAKAGAAAGPRLSRRPSAAPAGGRGSAGVRLQC